MGANIRCADCGFLSIRKSDEGNSKPCRETPPVTRETGHRPNTDFETRPYCFVEAIPIDEAYRKAVTFNPPHGENDRARLFKGVIDEPRACDQFCQYVPGKSPMQMKEMILSEEAKKHDDEQRARDREHVATEKEKDRAFNREEKDKDRQFNATVDRKKTAIGFIIQVVGGVILTLICTLLACLGIVKK